MLSVPWFLGWALRPYIQITSDNSATTEDRGGAKARAQVDKLSARQPTSIGTSKAGSATAPKPVTSPVKSPQSLTTQSKPYPVAIQPITAKGSNQTQTQSVEKVTVAKTAASGRPTSAAPPITPTVSAKQAQPVQASSVESEGTETLVSTKTITLKMSAEWAQQQIEKFKFSFDEADVDKSGSLSTDEVYNVLNKNGFKGSKDDAKQLFAHLDMNKDNKLSRDEFSAALNKLPRITVKEFVLRKAFKELDKDGSGTLTKAEIEAATKKDAGIAIAAQKVNELLEFLKKDSKDDVIDYEEFLRVFGIQETATVMYQVFSKLDKDNSGFLTKEEIMRALDTECELKLRAAKISDLLIAWHKDTDKKINYNEFVQVWIKYK